MGGPVCRSNRKTVRDRSGEETILAQREPVSQGGNIHPGKIVTAIESKNTNLYSGILYIKPRNTRAVKESKIADLTNNLDASRLPDPEMMSYKRENYYLPALALLKEKKTAGD